MCPCAEKKLRRVQSGMAKSSASQKLAKKTSTRLDDVTVTLSPTSSSSSSSTTTTTAATAGTTGSMLIRRRGLATTPVPAVLRIALSPPTDWRSLYKRTEPMPTRLVVDNIPAAVNLTTASGARTLSTSSLPSSSRESTRYHRVDDRTTVTTTTRVTARYSAVLSVTDLIGKLPLSNCRIP